MHTAPRFCEIRSRWMIAAWNAPSLTGLRRSSGTAPSTPMFFLVNRSRVDRLLGARAYRNHRHLLLVVRTRELLNSHADDTVLSPLNTGATKPMPHPRGRNCFLPMALYPFAHWRRKRGRRDAI